MNIIFLDFDGVICTRRYALASGEHGHISNLDPVALTFLDNLCANHNCKIVISSSWRHGASRHDFMRYFAAAGFFNLKKSLHKDWKIIESECSRGEQIQYWLDEHAGEFGNYAIIDDEDRMLESQQPHFVKTDMNNGMLFNHLQQVLNIFGISVGKYL